MHLYRESDRRQEECGCCEKHDENGNHRDSRVHDGHLQDVRMKQGLRDCLGSCNSLRGFYNGPEKAHIAMRCGSIHLLVTEIAAVLTKHFQVTIRLQARHPPLRFPLDAERLLSYAQYSSSPSSFPPCTRFGGFNAQHPIFLAFVRLYCYV